MKISYNWLKSLIDLDIKIEDLVNSLTMLGLEVEHVDTYEEIKASFEGLVIGEVLTCQQHPNAERLKLTTVDVGGDSVLQIVCGAPNVDKGQKVVVAQVGTLLHTFDNQIIKLKKSKIRGEHSEGMICAEDEIGLSEEHDGIIVLETDLPNGSPAKKYFNPYQDTIITIDLTPNRNDAASHLGVAKDLRALFSKKIHLPDVQTFKVDNHDLPIHVNVKNSEACPRYTGVTLKGIKIAESPKWLRNKLKSIGLKPINNVVDITNYAMFTIGQPLHAFDYSKIQDQTINVQTLSKGESFITLDGEKIKLQETDLMICDGQEKPMCIGGVFGGLDSGISQKTEAIFLEAAYFSAKYIRRSSLIHQLKTDAAYRFERGTDPNNTKYALQYTALLIKSLTGAEIASEIVDIYPKPIVNKKVKLLYANIDRLIGIKLGQTKIKAILKALDIEIIQENPESITVSVPTSKADVTREVDVIEEILRIYGYNQVKPNENLNASYLANTNLLEDFNLETKISHTLVGKGLFQIFTNPLTKDDNPKNQTIKIKNALSVDLNVMRDNLVLSGLEVIEYNINRKQFDLNLFEFCKIYELDEEKKFKERTVLGIWLSYKNQNDHWLNKNHELFFQKLSGIGQNILSLLNIKFYDQKSIDNQYIEGISYHKNGKTLAEMGMVKDVFIAKSNIKQDVLYAQIEWETCLKILNTKVLNQVIPKYPPVRRDLSLIMEKSMSYSDIEKTIKKADRRLIQDVSVFDVYQNEEQLGEGKKSYSVNILLQDKQKTLEDKAIDKAMKKVIYLLGKELGIKIRE